MKLVRIMAILALFSAAPAHATDHNNIDAGRPLRFEDADSIAFREQSLELGLGLGWPRRRPVGLALDVEYLYGFALNSHASVGFESSVGGRAGSRDTRSSFGDVSLGLFHNFNREHGNTPAVALRGDVFLPTGRDSQGVGFRVRGIMSKQADQYGRVHLNVDLNANPEARNGERVFHPGIVVGYSRPLGYPAKFTTTGLAELSVRAGEEKGTGAVLGIGLGIRKQVGVRSVFDLGIQSDVAGRDRADRDHVRLIAGYSYGF